MKDPKNRFPGLSWSAILLAALFFLAGCSDTKNLSIKINSVPKGAYVMYRTVGGDMACQGKWIFLGNTPIQSVRLFDEENIETAEKITLKIMYPGYFDQVKEWDGASFWKEIEERDVLFWTPELIPSTY